MILEYADYREFLKFVLTDRISKNPAYSLRSMAQNLQISPSLLSEVMRGKKNISNDKSFQVGKKLGLKKVELEYFVLLVQLESAKGQDAKDEIFKKLQSLNFKRNVTDLDVDIFKMISEWYHIPILAMTDLTKQDLTPKGISKHLGISMPEADAALDRLFRLGLLKKADDGRIQMVHQNAVFKSESSDRGLQHFHRKMLEFSKTSLLAQSNAEKFIGSETLAIDTKQISQAKEIIEECFDKLIELLKTGTNRTAIYHFTVQFFNLTKNRAD